MFKLIHQMLQLQDYYGISEEIDVLKGINKIPKSSKQAMKLAMRKIMSNRDKKDS